ncbi:MAG TPA: tRNA-dihydrouridine synthase [Candidatus Limnocylindrales bacterium]|nr:tRNA-dihydrouridine synthase [Candidatus Limnocylindrales bacterium]
MKAKKRVVTAGPQTPTRRTPTVRRVKSAIVPAVRRSPVPGVRATQATGPAGPATAGGIGKGDPDRAAGPSVDLAVDLGRGLVLANPLVAASGPFGFGVEVADSVDLGRLGAIVTRGTTMRARAGAPPPRMTATASGIVHNLGFQNPGVDAVIAKHEPTWGSWSVPVVVNVCGEAAGEFVEVVRRLEGLAGVAAVELNLGCPNAARGGTPFTVDPDAAAFLVGAVRRTWDRCLIAKLSPGASDIRSVARAVVSAGADALSAIGGVAALAVGGPGAGAVLTGPAIHPVAVRVVSEVAGAVGVPVVAYGGVASVDDVLDFLAVGAVAVGVGTAALADPSLPVRLAGELEEVVAARGLASYRDLVRTGRR